MAVDPLLGQHIASIVMKVIKWMGRALYSVMSKVNGMLLFQFVQEVNNSVLSLPQKLRPHVKKKNIEQNGYCRAKTQRPCKARYCLFPLCVLVSHVK